MELPELRRSARWLPLLMTLAAIGQATATPLQSGNVLVSAGNTLYEYTRAGVRVRTVPVLYGSVTHPLPEKVRDMVVDASGNVVLYNGTLDPYLSRYDVATDSWMHETHPGWSTANNVSHGNLARFENFVFATDMSTSGTEDSLKGLIRFELGKWAPTRFAGTVEFIDVAVGLDGLLYGLASNEYTIYVYDPATLVLVRTVSLRSGRTVRGIAVNQAGEIYGASWDDYIYRFSATGVELRRLYSGTYDLIDIELSTDGAVVVGARSGKVVFTDPQLLTLSSFTVGTSPTFVTVIPEPSPPPTDTLLISMNNTLHEYTVDGQPLWSIPIPSSHYARDLTVSRSGRIEIYNGTSTPSLSRYDRATATWVHWTYEGWSSTYDLTYGGIASWQDFVFATDMNTPDAGAPRGLVRFHLSTGAAIRFADTVDFIDVTMGQDGLLYGLEEDGYTIYVYDPATLALVRTMTLREKLKAIAVNSWGQIYAITAWLETICLFSPSGVLLAQVYGNGSPLIDIDISSVTGQVAVSSSGGTVFIADWNLTTLNSFFMGDYSQTFVSFRAFRAPVTRSN